VRELEKVIDHFGLDVVHAYMGHVQDNAEESVRRVLDVLHDGDFVTAMDDGAEIRVQIRIDKRAVIDFTGTSPQRPNNFNAPFAVTRAAVLYVFRTLVDDDIPLNSGCLKPLRLVIPERSMLNPRFPAAVVAGNVETSQCVADALYGAGTDAVHTHMTNSRLTDPEVLEWRYPVLVEGFSIRRGSGGGGRHGGGDGAVRRIRFLEPMTAAILSSRRSVPPFGLAGGAPGAPGRNAVERAGGGTEELAGTAEVEMAAGDVFVIETPGGGGFGAPD
jgi:5-oxoprolinase (ATP-hydrolysing)